MACLPRRGRFLKSGAGPFEAKARRQGRRRQVLHRAKRVSGAEAGLSQPRRDNRYSVRRFAALERARTEQH